MRYLLLLPLVLWLAACSVSIDGARYQALQPAFDLRNFFTGEVKAWGIVQDRSGNLVQRFQVDIVGSVAGTTLILDETFSYSLGEGVRQRQWRIEEGPDGSLSGVADDITGAAQGVLYGNALQWQYEMDLVLDSGTYRVSFDDWMWAFDSDTLINRSYIRKFGLVMAEVTIFMQKQP